MIKHRIRGWTVYIARSPEGIHYTGMCRDIVAKFRELNERRRPRTKKGFYVRKPPPCTPVNIIYYEQKLRFREALIKSHCLKKLHKAQRDKIIRTKKWPRGVVRQLYLLGYIEGLFFKKR